MGKLIEQLAPEYDFAVALKLDEFNNAEFEGLTAREFRGIDVAIEFSIPSAVPRNIEGIAALGVNLVVGTTGWPDHLEAVEAQRSPSTASGWSGAPTSPSASTSSCASSPKPRACWLTEPEYGAWAWEIHHAAKKDAPSGTLLKLVDAMKKAGYARNIDVGSNRAGAIPAPTKLVSIPADTITLRHTARSREGFARGALKAAQWIVGKKGFRIFRHFI